MKILVTGGAGFIGSHTVDRLLDNGFDVKVLDNLSPPVHPNGTKPLYLSNEAEFIKGDVLSKEDFTKALQGVSGVIHLAAYQDYNQDFSRFAMVNDVGTALLYEIIVGLRLPIQKVVVASSQTVYGEGKFQCEWHGVQYPPPRSRFQLEKGQWDITCFECGHELTPKPNPEEKVNPHNQYAISKYAQELYALILGKRHEIPTSILRYSITQGARQSPFNAYSGVLRNFALRFLQNQPPVVFEDGQQLRDYVYVGDVVSANLIALEDDRANYRVLNVAGEKSITVYQYARILSTLICANLTPVLEGEFRLGDTRHAISDASRLLSLGWRTTKSVVEIAQEYLDWLTTQELQDSTVIDALEGMRSAGVVRRSQKPTSSSRLQL